MEREISAESQKRVGRIAMAVMGLFILALAGGRAQAASFGFYLDGAGGSGAYDWQYDGFEYDVDVATSAMGLVIDTDPLGYSPASLRFNIGFEAQALEDDFDVTLDLGGIYLESIFAFHLIKDNNFSWWAGPLVRLGYYSGETEVYYEYDGFDFYPVRDEVDLFQFGIGGATGVNIVTAGGLILAPSLGVRFMSLDGTGKVLDLDYGVSTPSEDVSGDFTTVFVNLAVLF
ncbi:MAG: hypothetical protein ABFR97_11320 [Thermodesulfobacteriota bacterium]